MGTTSLLLDELRDQRERPQGEREAELLGGPADDPPGELLLLACGQLRPRARRPGREAKGASPWREYAVTHFATVPGWTCGLAASAARDSPLSTGRTANRRISSSVAWSRLRASRRHIHRRHVRETVMRDEHSPTYAGAGTDTEIPRIEVEVHPVDPLELPGDVMGDDVGNGPS